MMSPVDGFMFYQKGYRQNHIMRPCFLFGCFTFAPDSFKLAHGTDLNIGGLIVEWRNLVTEEKSSGRKWDSNPGPCR